VSAIANPSTPRRARDPVAALSVFGIQSAFRLLPARLAEAHHFGGNAFGTRIQPARILQREPRDRLDAGGIGPRQEMTVELCALRESAGIIQVPVVIETAVDDRGAGFAQVRARRVPKVRLVQRDLL